jgi:hypothetical protein
MKEKQAVTAVMSAEYKKASKKAKGAILDRFVEITKYARRYAARLLRLHGKKVRVRKTTIIGDARKRSERKGHRIYTEEVIEALIQIWMIMDCICGKRLQPALPNVIAALKRHREIRMSTTTERKLLKISASTIDRVLAPERKKQIVKGRSLTKPGSMLKHQIPIRTFSEWNEARPGFVEIDLVGHDGGDPNGDFCQTLDVTDVCTGWTETRAVRNKAQVWVFQALTHIRRNLPCPLLGIDSDNGSEFINHHLLAYCQKEQITFTRARPSRKNDNCFVEEKNASVVRRNVGYRRYDTPEHLEILNQLYDILRLYTNFFLPVSKLIRKLRIGSKIQKVHDKSQTPFERMLASPHLTRAHKNHLRDLAATLNVAQLKRNIIALQEQLVAIPPGRRVLPAPARARINLARPPRLPPTIKAAKRRKIA